MTTVDDPRELYIIVWGNYAKIGCSGDPVDRLTRVTHRGLTPPRQRGNPELVATVPGSMAAEQWLHATLAGHRANGEWFHLRGPVADLVQFAAAQADTAGIRALPAERPDRFTAPQGRRLVAMTVRRGPADLHARLQHAAVEPTVSADLGAIAACGALVVHLNGDWTPDHPRGCPDCVRRTR